MAEEAALSSGRRHTGGGLLLGLGYDACLGRNFSLVPFFNFLGGSFDGDTANFWRSASD